ncbi:MAG: hypothetical protein AAGI66_07575 [Cyanobacteria bacterium P01_H01_bin.74]
MSVNNPSNLSPELQAINQLTKTLEQMAQPAYIIKALEPLNTPERNAIIEFYYDKEYDLPVSLNTLDLALDYEAGMTANSNIYDNSFDDPIRGVEDARPHFPTPPWTPPPDFQPSDNNVDPAHQAQNGG